MKFSIVCLQVTALALIVLGQTPARGQESPVRTVTGHGMVELKKQAEFLRVEVEVMAKGKDIKEALSKLRDRRKAAQKQLEALGVRAAAIEFGKPKVVTEKNDQRMAMRQMVMMQRMGVGGKKPPQKAKEAPPVLVSAGMRAELRLQATDPDELVIECHNLEKQLRAANLGGAKELKQASPGDEELEQEENVNMMMGMNDNGEPKQGEPVFMYGCKISDEEQAKGLEQAFKKAKAQAARLARAAGAELGSLAQLNDQSGGTESDEEAMMYGQYNYRIRQLMNRSRGGNQVEDDAPTEAIGMHPAKVAYHLVVSAAFELKTSTTK